jgi:hypothetical protein
MFIALCFLFYSTVQGESPDPRKLFLDRYEPHAAKLAFRYTKIQYQQRGRLPQGSGRDQVMTVHGMFDLENYVASAEANESIDLKTKEAKALSHGVEGRNPRYEFSLDNKGEGRFVLAKCKLFSETPNTRLLPLCFPFALTDWGRTYLDIARDPETTVQEAHETIWNDQKVFEVRLEANYELEGKKNRTHLRLYFAPEAGWVCVGWEASDSADEYVKDMYSYDTSGEWARPTRYERWLVTPKDPKASRLIMATDILEFTPVTAWDESKFRLSAFGLPEPAGVVWPRPTPRYLWFLSAAIGLAVLAIGFRWLSRRRVKAELAQQGTI